MKNLEASEVWGVWRYEKSKDGKQTKIPYYTPYHRARVNDPSTWLTLQKARELKAHGGFSGLAVFFAEGIGPGGLSLCGVDIDGHDDGKNPLESEALKLFEGTYAERSPSGRGVHILFYADLSKLPVTVNEEGKRKLAPGFTMKAANGLEFYAAGLTKRYFTVTFKRVSQGEEITEQTEAARLFLEEFMKKPSPSPSSASPAGSSQGLPASSSSSPVTTEGRALTEDEKAEVEKRLKTARRAKNGKAFSALYDLHDLSEYNDDESRADSALCCMLAFYLSKNFALIDYAFRASALMRDKWDELHYSDGSTYGETTIKNALQIVDNEYKPRGARGREAAVLGFFGAPVPSLTVDTFAEFCEREGFEFKYDEIRKEVKYLGFSKEENISLLPNTAPYILKNVMGDGYTNASVDNINGCISVLAGRNTYNAMLEAIQAIKWDGADRIKEIFALWKIPEEDALSRVLIVKWLKQTFCMLLNTHEKAFAPEFCLVLSGGQGAGKTRFFEHLAMNPLYFGEGQSLDPDNKDTIIQGTSVWICELGEIGSTMKRDLDKLKAFMTKPFDEYRPPYGRAVERHPRKTSFCGTVNNIQFLKDDTGSRRWGVIRLKEGLKVDFSEIKRLDAGQLWAQVRELVESEIAAGKWKNRGECYRLTAEEVDALENRNAAYTTPAAGVEEVRDVLQELDRDPTAQEWVMTVTQFQQENKALQRFSRNQIGQALQKLGYEQKRTGTGGRGYLLPRRSVDW